MECLQQRSSDRDIATKAARACRFLEALSKHHDAENCECTTCTTHSTTYKPAFVGLTEKGGSAHGGSNRAFFEGLSSPAGTGELAALRGPPSRPDPQNPRFPTLKNFNNPRSTKVQPDNVLVSAEALELGHESWQVPAKMPIG